MRNSEGSSFYNKRSKKAYVFPQSDAASEIDSSLEYLPPESCSQQRKSVGYVRNSVDYVKKKCGKSVGYSTI